MRQIQCTLTEGSLNTSVWLRCKLVECVWSTLAHISILNSTCESLCVRQRQYLYGFERDEDAPEVSTQWVRYKINPFSSPSTPLSRSISKVPALLPTAVPQGGMRELDERLGFGELIKQHLADSRGKNTQLPLADLLRQ